MKKTTKLGTKINTIKHLPPQNFLDLNFFFLDLNF